MSSPEMLTPRQSRAARALIGWTQKQLAKEASVAHRTVIDFESEERGTASGTKALIAMALVKGGAELLDREGVCRR